MNGYSAYLDWIDTQADTMRELLVAWANINSGSFNVEGVNCMGDVLRAYLAKFGEEIVDYDLPGYQRIDAQGNPYEVELGRALSIRKRPEAPIQVLLNGHFDTVYGPHHSFQKVWLEGDDILHGPGVADLKGGLLVMLTALEAFERSPYAQQIGWELFLNPDEELGSPGSKLILEDKASHFDVGLIFEPSLPDGSLIYKRKGTGSFTLVVRGKGGHAGRDFEGSKNALVKLAELAQRAHGFNDEIPGVIVNVAKLDGGDAENMIPDTAVGRFNVRADSIKNQQQLEQAFFQLVSSVEDGYSCELSGGFRSKPKEYDEKTQQLFESFQTVGRDLGLDLQLKASGGSSDGNRLAAMGLPTIDTLGVRGNYIHTEKEFCFLSSLSERAKLTALYLMQLADGTLQKPAV